MVGPLRRPSLVVYLEGRRGPTPICVIVDSILVKDEGPVRLDWKQDLPSKSGRGWENHPTVVSFSTNTWVVCQLRLSYEPKGETERRRGVSSLQVCPSKSIGSFSYYTQRLRKRY